MTSAATALPDDIASLKTMVIARDQLIETLMLTIGKLRHAKNAASSERGRKLLDQERPACSSTNSTASSAPNAKAIKLQPEANGTL